MTLLELNTVPGLSLFLPCWNEEQNLAPLVERAAALLPDLADEHEILVVNDGSTDGTRDLALSLAARFPAVRLVDIPHGGYGAALNAGFMNAKYPWVAFLDADAQFSVDDLPRLMAFTDSQSCIIGFREARAETGVRRVNQFLLKVWAYVLFGIPWDVRDINCGFKLIRRDVLAECLPLAARGGIVSTELMRGLVRQRIPIAQVGVRHFPRQHGKATGADPRVILKAVLETVDLLVLPSKR